MAIKPAQVISAQELDLALSTGGTGCARADDPAASRFIAKLACARQVPGLCDVEVLNIATEVPISPADSINTLIEGLRFRGLDDVALAALAAIQYYHVPAILDQARTPR